MTTTFRSTLIFLLVISFAFVSCKKEEVQLNDDPTNPISGGNSGSQVLFSGNTITASIGGTVFDQANNPVSNALVTIGNQTTYTNQLGIFLIDNVLVDENRAYVKVEKSGYFLGSRTIHPDPSDKSFVEIKLLLKTSVGSVNNSSGGAVTVSGGSIITFDSGDVSLENGDPYTGTVNVYASYLDPSSSDIGEIMPGDLQAVNSSGSAVVLESYGMMVVELTGSGGEALNVTPGQTVQLTMPVPSGQLGSAPSSIPMWYFDEVTGNWVEEGSASLVGNEYVGNVGHFSFWNCDRPYPGVGFSMRIVCNGTPSSGTQVRMRSPNGTFYGTSYTNTNGELNEMMPGEVEVIMDVYDVCNNVVHSQNLGTNYSNLALGDVNICLGANTSTVIGAIVDCNNNPINNSLLSIAVGSNNLTIFADNNGAINNIINTCGQDSVLVTAYNLDQNLQSASIYVATGSTINIGNLSTCSQIDEFINYTLDGVQTIIQDLGQNEVSTELSNIDTLGIGASDGGNQSIYFFVAATSTGSYPNCDIPSLPFPGMALFVDTITADVNSITVDITTFGTSVGSYVEGTFSGNFNSTGGTPHTLTGQFRVRRDY